MRLGLFAIVECEPDLQKNEKLIFDLKNSLQKLMI